MWSIALDGLVYLLTNQVSNVVLFASSYTTLTYLTHTFSNGWESLLVLLMLKADSHPTLSLFMGVIAALGLFTRPSFIFFMIPLAYTHSRRIFKVSDDDDSKRIKLNFPEIGFLVYSAATFTLAVLAIIALDTWYYVGHVSLDMYEHSVVLTVLNNFKYNSNIENLAHHGLHPHYLHLINAVALLGPALFMIPRHQVRKNLAAACMATGFLGLSCIPHQEARFLLPCTTLFFTTLRTKQFKSWFLILWVAFNSLGAIGFGILHQSGVIPSALFIAQEYPTANVTFTKCYPAPVSLLGPTVTVTHAYGDSVTTPNTKLVVTPVSNKSWNSSNYELIFRENWHVNLDDFDVLGLDVFLNRGMGVFLEKQSPSPPYPSDNH